MTVQEIATILENKGLKLKGCSPKEINEIESFYGVKLPITYVNFLERMGKGAGTYLEGSSVFYDEIFELREWATELLSENNFKSLPKDGFVFYMHQGYQFAFFYLFDGEDPPVYYYYEGRNRFEFERKEEKFTDFLTAQLAWIV